MALPEAEASAPPQAGHVIVFLAMATFAAAATNRVMDAILPQMALEFGTTIGSVAFVATAYAVAYGAFQVVFGPLGDRFGAFRVILWACMASSVATLACALSGTLNGIAVARFLSGVSAAAIVPLSLAWVGHAIPHEDRQPVLARFMSSQILGLLAGQIGGGVMGEMFGWRSTFLLLAAVYVIAIAGLMAARRRGAADMGSGPGGDRAVRRALRNYRRLLGDPVVRFVLFAVSLEALAMFGAFTYVGAALNIRFGYDFATVGAYLAAFCIGGLVYVSQSRRLYALLGNRKLPFVGTLIVAACYLGLAVNTVGWLTAPLIAVLGLGFYMLHNTMQTMATEMAPDMRGSAMAIFATCYFMAQAIGVQLGGQIIDRVGFGLLFAVAAVLLVALGALLLVAMPRQLRTRAGTAGKAA